MADKRANTVRLAVPVDPEKIASFCRKHHIREMSLFGSVLRDDFHPDSDVDVLVEFDPENIPGFFGLIRMEDELASYWNGRAVDLVTKKGLNHRLRRRVLDSARVIYAEG